MLSSFNSHSFPSTPELDITFPIFSMRKLNPLVSWTVEKLIEKLSKHHAAQRVCPPQWKLDDTPIYIRLVSQALRLVVIATPSIDIPSIF